MRLLGYLVIPALLVAAPCISRAEEPVIESRPGSGGAPPIISMRLEDTDIRSALRAFADILHLNIVARPEVAGSVRRFRLVDVAADEAFAVLLRTAGLAATQEGNVVVVYPIGVLLEEQQKRLGLKRLDPE